MSIFTHVIIGVLCLSAGVVLGRFVRTPIGRWAAVVVVIALVFGSAYLYGMIGALQHTQELAAAANAANIAKTFFGIKLPW